MNKRSNIEDFIPRILELYKKGMSTPEIEELLHLPVSQRQVQRIIKKFGLTRTKSESFRLAIRKGRRKFKRLGPGMGAKEFRKGITLTLRYAAFKRDGFKCTLCGYDVEDGVKLEVDHIVRPINSGKNTLENLRTICSACNIGRWHAEQKHP
ncbi:HNH endonuclease [Candidatus Daviesbacteria bacterium]|nr:HNH endonuclease [Candidatus Daviesbacteria bacterium]